MTLTALLCLCIFTAVLLMLSPTSPRVGASDTAGCATNPTAARARIKLPWRLDEGVGCGQAVSAPVQPSRPPAASGTTTKPALRNLVPVDHSGDIML